MQAELQKQTYSLESIKENLPLQRLLRLKGKIWALTLEQAQKYHELAAFACPVALKQKEELQKINSLLQKRIDKLTRRQIFEKAELQQKRRLELLDKELERIRTSIVDTTNRKERVSLSVGTIKEFDVIMEALRPHNTEHSQATDTFSQQMSLEEKPSEETENQEKKQASSQLMQPQATYKELYSHIAELESMDGSQLQYLDSEQQEKPKPKLIELRPKSPRKRVFQNFCKYSKQIVRKIGDVAQGLIR